MRFHITWMRRPGRVSRLRSGAASGRARRPIARPRVEALESRSLLSATINEFFIPGGDLATNITAGPDGNLWFTEAGANQIGEFNPTIHAVAEFPIPTPSQPNVINAGRITAGPDGNIWFTEIQANKIGEINPTTHAITEFPLPGTGGGPTAITAGPDGNVWFTGGEINPVTHTITEFPSLRGTDITTGPDGNLWFTTLGTFIDRFDLKTHAVTPFLISSNNTEFPAGITAGPDGNIWFTENLGSKIGEINPTTGAISEFPLPTDGGSSSVPVSIAVGSDGNLWFTEFEGGQIGEINPTTHAITEFPVTPAESHPDGITAGPDGNLWFTEQAGQAIGQVELAAPTAPDLSLTGSAPTSITLGQSVTYTLTLTNDGTGGATGVTLTDTLPSGATFVSATGGVTPVGGVLTFSIGSLVSGGNATVTVVVTPTAAGSLTDTATARMDQTDPTPADNSLTLPTTVVVPDLALSGDAPTSVTLGQNVTYTLTVANNGAGTANGATLTDTLPAGVTFVSATGGVTPVNDVLTFALGSLAAGASTSVTIVVTPTAAGTLSNRATITASQTDPTPADNSVARTTTVTAAPTVTSVQRFGFHLQPTTLVLTFDQPLDPARAQDLANYRLAALDGPRGTIRIGSAVYDPATRTVTLRPVDRLYLYHRFRLTVVGTGRKGVSDPSGDLMDGQGTGWPGSDLVTTLSAANLVLTPAEQTDARLMREIKSLSVKYRRFAHLVPAPHRGPAAL
jgi:virginiamycin B lyase